MAIANEELVQARRIAEYQALEKRMQNDSTIAYAFNSASIAAVSILITASLDLHFRYLSAEPSAIVLSVMAIVLAASTFPIMERINATGEIRRARAVQLEKELGFFSFRLFEPWDATIPEDYFITLGEIERNNLWNGSNEGRAGFIFAGRQQYTTLTSRRRWSSMFKAISASLLIVSVILLIYLLMIFLSSLP